MAGLSANDAADRVAAAIGLYQGPTEEKKVSVGTMDVLTILPVWAAGAFSGAMLNLLYPMFLMTKQRSLGRSLDKLEGGRLDADHGNSDSGWH